MELLEKRLVVVRNEVDEASHKLKLDELTEKLDELNSEMAKPDFWQDSGRAQEISQEAGSLSRRLEPWRKLKSELNEVEELLELNDSSMRTELQAHLESIESQFEDLQEQLKFQGPYDDHDVVIEIYAGAGGTDAQDWAGMLQRMYTRWAESQKLKTELLEESAGEEAGIKSATLKISGGEFLYGRLSGEHGVHRLVRLSPFNANDKRQTSFARVDVLPLIDKPGELDIDEKDLKVDVYRSSGKGGQSVNTTDSAVRITHAPTGIVIAIQNERSQLQNKETAMSVLRSKLAQLQLEQHTESLAEIKGPSKSAEWGNQIRSYVLHPYKQVKDVRSGYESSDVEKVLDGELDPLLN